MDPGGGFPPVVLLLSALLLLLRASAGYVEPPTSVTLDCRNLHNVLEWSYNQLSTPGLKFKVDIKSLSSSPSEIWINSSTSLQADLSSFSDPKNEYLICVMAVIGQNESECVPQGGFSYSYFKDAATNRTCFLDFPPVNVTALQDDNVLLRFTHPWLLYHQQRPDGPNPKQKKKNSRGAKIRQELPMFNYDVVIIGQKERHQRLDCEESVCEEKLPVDAAQEKHCVKVKGELLKMAVRGTEEYCAMSSPMKPSPSKKANQNNAYIYIVVSVLVVIAVAFVLFMVYQKMTKPSTSLPNSMRFTDRLKQWTMGVVQEQVSKPEVEPTSPTLLLPEEKESILIVSASEPELRLCIGVSAEDEGVSDVGPVGNDEGPCYMPGRELDEDETLCPVEHPSEYEKRQVLVDIAPDEQTEGYRG